MTDMFFANNTISHKALQKCQPFCPIYKHNWHHFIIFFLLDLLDLLNMHTYGDLDIHDIYINDVQLFVTIQRKSTKTQFWSDVTKITGYKNHAHF